MQCERILVKRFSIIFMIALVTGCVSMNRPQETNFKDPLIGLDHVEVSYYTGFYYFSSDVTPTRGKADNYGAPLLLTFVYKIHNPNRYPIMLDGFSFTVMFENFKVKNLTYMVFNFQILRRPASRSPKHTAWACEFFFPAFRPP